MTVDPHPKRLVVFADDWGRHPSSCQHLVRWLLPRWTTLWVNTIGTRRPRLTRQDLGRAVEKVQSWIAPRAAADAAGRLPPNLQTLDVRMWPGFRSRWQRRINTKLMWRAVGDALLDDDRPTVVLTTLPITAGLIGELPVDRWVYYCVDDFSTWPGLDAQVMRTMERELLANVDAVVAVSEALCGHAAALGKTPTLLTHGIDPGHWQARGTPLLPGAAARPGAVTPLTLAGLPRPVALFWGLIDPRLDIAWCEALAATGGTLVLVGPQQSPSRRLAAMKHVRLPGPAAYDDLPALAAAADVLVMPYADLPVTHAMQPLKFKEYLATGRPVVARGLPSTTGWADCADVVATAEAFVAAVRQRAAGGAPAEQLAARARRLAHETWEQKARALESVLTSDLR